MTAGPEIRQKALTWACALTPDPSDGIAVVTTAGLLLDWIEAADDEQDFLLRASLMERYYANVFFGSTREGLTAAEFVTNTDLLYLFVTGARVIHLFTQAVAPPEAA